MFEKEQNYKNGRTCQFHRVIQQSNSLGICTEFWLHRVSCNQNWHDCAAVARNNGNSKKSNSTNSVQQCIFCIKALCTRFFSVFFARTICTKFKHVCMLHISHGRAPKSPCKHPALFFQWPTINWIVSKPSFVDCEDCILKVKHMASLWILCKLNWRRMQLVKTQLSKTDQRNKKNQQNEKMRKKIHFL